MSVVPLALDEPKRRSDGLHDFPYGLGPPRLLVCKGTDHGNKQNRKLLARRTFGTIV
jgi:hypothetical protein